MSAVLSRVGWCPGVLRPMAAGDGLLARVKPRGGRLTPAQAMAVADAAARFGNGVLAITGRANLQLRGVREDALDGLAECLARHGLLDAGEAAEAVRNVLRSPLAGLDPAAALDVRPLAAALERALADDPAFHRLPAKFAWSVDDGGARGGLDGAGSDVAFTARPGAGADGLQVVLAGAPAVAARCAPTAIVAAAEALAGAFLAMCRENAFPAHRMRDLVAARGAAAVFDRAGLAVGGAPPVARPVQPVVGLDRVGSWRVVGLVPPFGRLQADALGVVAAAADRLGAEALRLAPWRGLVIAAPDGDGAAALCAAAVGAGWIVDPADPRLSVSACSGAPACHRAAAPVQAHAARWASHLGPAASAVRLHVSGCAKGCAHPAAAPLTLVARGADTYDLVRGGHAGDPPDEAGLSVEAVAAMLAAGAVARGGHRPGL